MKLLLTSAGLQNKSIADAMFRLTGKTNREASVAYIPTAANVEPGHKDWLLDDFSNFFDQNLKCFDIVDISALPKEKWLPRLDEADILTLGGGNTFHLMYWVNRSGLKKILPDLLKEKVYVGISAGSQITNPLVDVSVQNNLFDEENEHNQKEGLNLVNFYTIPHFSSKDFPIVSEENVRKYSENIDIPVYALDDQSAIVVDRGKIEVVSEGSWLQV